MPKRKTAKKPVLHPTSAGWWWRWNCGVWRPVQVFSTPDGPQKLIGIGYEWAYDCVDDGLWGWPGSSATMDAGRIGDFDEDYATARVLSTAG
jgi:hypothetical protein